jgi:hypothetical protein
VRWHYEKRERLNEFEALAVERNVVDWVLGKARVDDVPATFAELMSPPAVDTPPHESRALPNRPDAHGSSIPTQ